MDSVLSSARRQHHLRPSPLPPDRRAELPADDIPPPPPRHPLRRGGADTDSHSPSRPCPPPPLPAREPLVRPAARNADPPPTAPGPCGSSALDSVVPLSRWPLRSDIDKPPSIEPARRPALPVNMLVVSTASSSVHTPPVSAAPPKPCSGVRGNVYVDSPTVNRAQHPAATSPDRPATTDCRGGPASLHPPPPFVKFSPVGQTNGEAGGTAASEKAVVTGQPRAAGDRTVCRGGVMCQRCGRCRCANCTAPRELPRRWIGDWECSVQRCVSFASCLCCVEALFYHCLDGADADDGGAGPGAADDPCACCERPRCCLRWTLMTALATTVLPCLCCYCPLQCAADGLTACYNACAGPRGCRCRGAARETSSGSSTRGLLAESESSST